MPLVSKILVLVFVAVWVCQVYGVPSSVPATGSSPEHQCRRAEFSSTKPKGENILSKENWHPVYKLSVVNTGSDIFTVSIDLGNKLRPFSDAFISIDSNSSCGVGDFEYDDDDFFRVAQPYSDCPLLLTTNRKSVMRRLPPLHWKAPKCGCVQFRAKVIEAASTYFAELPNVAEGPLATSVCSSSSVQPTRPLSKERRRDLLCQVTERNSGLSVVQRPSFMHRHRLEPRYMDMAVIELALSARRMDISACCRKAGDEREECLRDVQRRRVDSLCEDGSPDIPFTALRAKFMRQRESHCCWKLGEARYACFSEDAELKTHSMSADFSLDETDPLNDLADYDEEITALEKEYGSPLFAGEVTTTTPTTTTTTTTTSTTQPLPRVTSRAPLSSLSDPRLRSRERTSDREHEGKTATGQRRYHLQEPSLASREIGEQQGGSSIDKTFASLQRRMWKLSLKTQCCEGGVHAAKAAYGDFHAVWKQCGDSASKYLALNPLPHGHKICSTQFHRCCMEIVVSIPSEVVTLAPDRASSREWDRDRHLVHTVYIPPHARPGMTSRQRHASSSRRLISTERKVGVSRPMTAKSSADTTKPVTRSPLYLDVDEDPQNKRHKQPRRSSSTDSGKFKKRGSSKELRNSRERLNYRKRLSSRERPNTRERSRSRENVRSRERLRSRERIRSRELVNSRRKSAESLNKDGLGVISHKRLRNLNSRERKLLGRSGQRSRERLDEDAQRSVDESEQEDEVREPLREHTSGGRSKVRKNKQRSRETSLSRDDPNTKASSLASGDPQTKLRQSSDNRNQEDGLYGEEADTGSEENADTLGFTIPDVDGDEDEDYESDYDESDENVDLVEDTSKDINSKNESNSKTHSHGKSETIPDVEKKTTEEIPKQSIAEITSKPTDTETSNQESLTPKAPHTSGKLSKASGNILGQRRRILRTRQRGSLSDEDGHSSRHSGGFSRRRKRKHHTGRKRMRNLRHRAWRLRTKHRRRDLSEDLEED